jgi:hypothetical protein
VFAGYSNDARAYRPGISAWSKWLSVNTVTSGKIHNTTVRVNGVNATMSKTGSNVSMNVSIGTASGNGFGGVGGIGTFSVGKHMFKGYIAEVIVYASALSTSARQQVEGYLNAKYKIH